MNSEASKGSKIKKCTKVAIGTVATIGICALVFSGLTQSVKAAVVNKTDTIQTAYSSTAGKESSVPPDYEKTAYQVKFQNSADKPTAKDMSGEEAAELGAQKLSKLFGVDLKGKTIEMSYIAATSDQRRAVWMGCVKYDKDLYYWFTVDAVTGEFYATEKSNQYTILIRTG